MSYNYSIGFGNIIMSYKIQITVDEKLNNTIKALAKQTGLSVSSYARLALMNVLQQKSNNLLNRAMDDIKSNNTETLSLTEFTNQLNNL